MNVSDLNTPVHNTWCPGCPNFTILAAAKQAVTELVNSKFARLEDFVSVAGIGCHAKIYDYIGISGFYGLHGRAVPVANGITLGNPNMHVLTFVGDGDLYAEGISHFIHAARMNANQAVFVHNNKVYALTTGQFTPTTEKGFKCRSAPEGNPIQPLNPIALALEAGATFVARESTLDMKSLVRTMKAAIKHRGFALVDILQPCLSFHNFTDYVSPRIYRLKAPLGFDDALKKAHEWDYSLDPKAKIPVGVFYRARRRTLDEAFGAREWKGVRRTVSVSGWSDFKV